MRSTTLPLSSHYRDAIRFTLLQQVPCALLCLLMLDGGRMAKVCGATMIGYWIVATLIMLQRPLSPTAGDRAFLRWGFLALFVVAACVSRFVFP